MNQRNMNSTATSQFFEDEPDSKCYGAFLPVWKSGRLSAEAYTVLIFTTIVSLLTLPLTILLNALVIVAVKTTRRLRTKSNILLACLAATDFMVAFLLQWKFCSLRERTLARFVHSKRYPESFSTFDQRVLRRVAVSFGVDKLGTLFGS